MSGVDAVGPVARAACNLIDSAVDQTPDGSHAVAALLVAAAGLAYAQGETEDVFMAFARDAFVRSREAAARAAGVASA